MALSAYRLIPEAIWDPLPRLPERLTVLLADDHAFYREGLARAVSSHLDLELAGEAGDGDVALALIEEVEPDVALLDVKMPGIDGLEVCRRLLERRPAVRTRIVLLSAFLDVSLVSRAVCAGAVGYLSKDVSREEICDAVAGVAAGRTAFGSHATSGLVEELERLYELEPPGPPATKGV